MTDLEPTDSADPLTEAEWTEVMATVSAGVESMCQALRALAGQIKPLAAAYGHAALSLTRPEAAWELSGDAYCWRSADVLEIER